MNSKVLLRKWIAAFIAKDLEAVMDCYADDAVNFQVAAGEPATGKEQIRRDMLEFAAFPTRIRWSKTLCRTKTGQRGNGMAAARSKANFTVISRPANRSSCAAADFLISATGKSSASAATGIN